MKLDVGCGKHPTDADVTIDITKDSLCDINADAHHLPFKNEVFNKVVMYEVLEHLSNPEKALTEINRVLRPNGELQLSIPNAIYWRAIIR